MKREKQTIVKSPYEYQLIISKKYNSSNKKILTQFQLQTIHEFTNFKYVIIVDSVLNNHTIYFDIRGLRAPFVTIPNTGPAVFTTEYENLSGNYDVIISKGLKTKNKFSIQINKKNIILKKLPQKAFVELITKNNN